MPVVLMPDGVEVDMPDNPSPEALAALKKRFGAGAGALESSARDLIGGFGKAAAMAPRALQMLAGTYGGVDSGMTPEKSGTLVNPRVNPLARALGDMADSTEDYWTKFRDKSTNPRYVQAALRGIGGAAAAPVGGIVGLTAGAGGGVGEEAAASIAPGNPLASAAGGLVGGLAAGSGAAWVARARPQSASIAKEITEGLTEKQLLDGQAYMNKMKAEGIDIDFAQALTAQGVPAHSITAVRDFLANRRQGNKVQGVLERQPTQLGLEANLTAESLPGRNFGMQESANRVQEASTKAIVDTRRAGTKLWEDTAQKSVQALQATEQVKVAEAKTFADTAGLSLGTARGRVQSLLADIQKARQGDSAAVAGVEKKIAETQQLLESLQKFSLPRGTASTTRGKYLTESQYGKSILKESAAREAQSDTLALELQQLQRQATPSAQTLQLQRQLTSAQGTTDVAETAQTQAQKALQEAQLGYDSVTKVPETALKTLNGTLDDLIKKFPNSVQERELSQLKAALKGPKGPLTDPAQINRIFTEFTARVGSPDALAKGMDPGTARYLKGQVQELREGLGQSFAPIRDANEAYKTFTQDVYNPLKQGPIGRLAGPGGFDPATASPISRFEGMMNKGVDPSSKTSDVKTAFRELSKVDPGAAENAFKSWVSEKIAKASVPGLEVGGPASNADMAKRIAAGLFDDTMRWQGVKDATAELAKARGDKPEEVIRGLENLRRLTTAMKNRPDKIGGVSPTEIREMGGASNIANAMQVFSLLPVSKAARGLEQAVLAKTLTQFADILTSPEAAKMLIELGKVPVMSRKAQVILGTFGGSLGNSDGLRINNPPE